MAELAHFLKMNREQRVEQNYLQGQQFVQQLVEGRLEREWKLACPFRVTCDEWSAEAREACAQLCHRERAGSAILRQQSHCRHRKIEPQNLEGEKATCQA